MEFVQICTLQLKGHGICTQICSLQLNGHGICACAALTWHLCENLLAIVHIWKWSFKTGNFALLFTKQGGLWLGMTGGLSTQVKMNVKPLVHSKVV